MKVYCLAQKCDAAVSDLLNATSLQAVQGISAFCVIIALTLLWSYMRPFAEVIPWQQISLHASYDHLSSGAFLAALQRIPAAKLQHMQHGVLHAWTHHLAPAASVRTFYQLLRGRAEFRDRR